jgi:predicted nucleotidyltransferase
MTRRRRRIGRCYRCLHTWVMRRRRPSICPRCKSRFYDVPVVRPLKPGRGLGIPEVVSPHRDRVLGIMREGGAEALWVFGSVRRAEANRRSDIDLLVRWRKPVSLLEKASFLVKLEQEFGRKVDLVDWSAVHWALAPQIHSEAVPL